MSMNIRNVVRQELARIEEEHNFFFATLYLLLLLLGAFALVMLL
ncbi:hypothetical protein M199_gp135 [Halogranum tailed virus 1]|uniref:Uncharacterized protein n=1 Tax=Halogranum tailed virus 1 TaxID=1273749 RepID=R4TGX7_9CAUD|nr:hypothetical protein M199_gp135 [Halogranum tailed virus 1]AGM11531.1 hypothetical protein HGTV1_234 [Halogranum tailed virus 1]